MAIVFVDVFFIYNFFINLVLLVSTKLICFAKTKAVNLIIGAFLSAFYSVCRMIFEIGGVTAWIMDFIVFWGILFLVFIPENLKKFIKISLIFFVVNFIYGGAMFFLVYFFNMGIHFGGRLFYIDLSILPLIISAIAIYMLLYFSKRVIDRNVLLSKKIYNLEIRILKETITTKALYDTGNNLFEPISGAPVILIEDSLLKDKSINIATYRFIPYRSAGGSGYISAFAAEEIKINNKKVDVLVYVAILSGILSKDGEYKAVLHPFTVSEGYNVKEMCSVDI